MNYFKHQITIACETILRQKLSTLKYAYNDVTISANNETKSSAGDKHETGRAMMQLEQEKLGKQLQEAEDQLTDFMKIDFTKSSIVVNQGSLIETNNGYFFIATSIGKIEVLSKTVFVISSKSPVAIAFLGKKNSDEITFNGVLYSISTIF